VQHRRAAATCAIPALFVALLVLAGPLAGHHSAPATAGPARHAIVAGDTPISPATVSSLELSRRGSTFGALVAYLAVALSIALALSLRITGGISSWARPPCADRTRRDRAPPFTRA
jgi:hypothetical protein